MARLGKFIRMVPRSVMMGFVNGLAIVIFLSQLEMFQSGGVWIGGVKLWTMVALVALTMGILTIAPKIYKKAPGALIAIIAVSLLVIFAGINTETVLKLYTHKRWYGYRGRAPELLIPQGSINI